MFYKGKGFWPFLSVILWVVLHNSLLAQNWTAPNTISSGGDAEDVRLGIDPSSNVYANWSLNLIGTQVIQSSIMPNGGSFSLPIDVSDPTDNIGDQELAVDYSGNAYAVWNPMDAQEAFILGSSRPNNFTWTSSTILQEVNGPSAIRVAARYYGTAIAVWTANQGGNSVIQTASFINGAWVLPAITISDPTQNADHAAVGIDYNGNAIVVYESNNGSNTVIQSTMNVGGIWSIPINLSYDGSWAFAPQIAVNDAGNAVAVWKRENGSNWVVESSTLINQLYWTLPVELSYPNQDADLPQIGIDAYGRAAAVWKRFDGSNYIVQGTVSLGGNAWIRPVSISLAGEDADAPQVKVNSNGQIIAAFSRSDGSNFIAEASTTTFDVAAANPSNYWSSPVDLSITGSDALYPQVTLDNAGNAVVAWQYGLVGAYVIQAVVGTSLF